MTTDTKKLSEKLFKGKAEGFSLLEVLVVMMVIAALLVLGINGIFVLQRKSRDNNRISAGNEISKLINNYLKEKLRYPPTDEVTFNKNEVTVGIEGKYTHTLSGPLKSAFDSSSKGTRYFYSTERGGFILCALLESGKVESFGNRDCPAKESWL